MRSGSPLGSEVTSASERMMNMRYGFHVARTTLFLFVAATLAFGSAGLLAGCDDTAPNSSDTAGQLDVSTSEAESDGASAEQEAAQDVPADYTSALNQARSYSDTLNMSKQGIYDQLTSEYGGQFSPEAAQYAIDNVQADWNANALAKAGDYSDTMHMSKQGIYDQLVSEHGEKFTPEEAQYAVDNLQADYNANALAKARDYQEMMSMSPEAIRDQLVSEYGEKFTQEEADYAVANL